jgi:hypothetical protein
MAGTSSAKTRFALLPGHDGKRIVFELLESIENACCFFGFPLSRAHAGQEDVDLA